MKNIPFGILTFFSLNTHRLAKHCTLFFRYLKPQTGFLGKKKKKKKRDGEITYSLVFLLLSCVEVGQVLLLLKGSCSRRLSSLPLLRRENAF